METDKPPRTHRPARFQPHFFGRHRGTLAHGPLDVRCWNTRPRAGGRAAAAVRPRKAARQRSLTESRLLRGGVEALRRPRRAELPGTARLRHRRSRRLLDQGRCACRRSGAHRLCCARSCHRRRFPPRSRPGGRNEQQRPPGLRAHYGASYYAAFVCDPDGNNVEALFNDEL